MPTERPAEHDLPIPVVLTREAELMSAFGTKRTLRGLAPMSAFDPKRTSGVKRTSALVAIMSAADSKSLAKPNIVPIDVLGPKLPTPVRLIA